jgi:beta-phosphoglucomutase
VKYSAFIFDLDGVLTDTAEYHYRAWKRLADEEEIVFSREDNEKLRGVSRRASINLILKEEKLPEQKIIEMMERKNSYYRQFIKEMSKADLLPGAEENLMQLKAAGFKLALASASKNARTVLDKLGIESNFDYIADGHSVEKTKPAPDLFLFAAEKLGVHPQACIVVEDAEAGVTAARAAGMSVIGIGPAERVGKADLVYNSLAEVNLEKIINKLP